MLASLAFLYVDKCTDHKNAEVARPFGPRPLFKVFFLKKTSWDARFARILGIPMILRSEGQI